MCGGSMYRPTMSRILSMKSGAVESLKVSRLTLRFFVLCSIRVGKVGFPRPSSWVLHEAILRRSPRARRDRIPAPHVPCPITPSPHISPPTHHVVRHHPPYPPQLALRQRCPARHWSVRSPSGRFAGASLFLKEPMGDSIRRTERKYGCNHAGLRQCGDVGHGGRRR